MAKYSVIALTETTYTVIADSEAEAEEKAQTGEVEEEEYGGINQIISVDLIIGGDDIPGGLECVSCGKVLTDEDSIAAGKCEDCLVIDNDPVDEGDEDEEGSDHDKDIIERLNDERRRGQRR